MTSFLRHILPGAVALSLCSCAGGPSDVSIVPQTAATYAPVSVSAVNISSHPPKGHYEIIALLTLNVRPGETPTQFLARLQQTGASIGADYVLMTSVADKTFLTPQNLDSENNVYLATQRNFDATAGSGNDVGEDYMREVVKAQALKITSGSHAPNRAAPSLLWH